MVRDWGVCDVYVIVLMVEMKVVDVVDVVVLSGM